MFTAITARVRYGTSAMNIRQHQRTAKKSVDCDQGTVITQRALFSEACREALAQEGKRVCSSILPNTRWCWVLVLEGSIIFVSGFHSRVFSVPYAVPSSTLRNMDDRAKAGEKAIWAFICF